MIRIALTSGVPYESVPAVTPAGMENSVAWAAFHGFNATARGILTRSARGGTLYPDGPITWNP